MGLFDIFDRNGNNRSKSKGPKVKSGPTKGLTRAKNKDGRWRKTHVFK